MTMTPPNFARPNSSSSFNFATQRLNQLQTDLVVTARVWAVDEVGAAMAHRLNEPLTALLIYLHEIQAAGECAAETQPLAAATLDVIGKAVREAERACELLEEMRNGGVEAQIDPHLSLARGRSVIDALAHRGDGHSVAQSAPSVRTPSLEDGLSLTPREQEVLAHITAGASNKEGSHRLGISTRTFEVHRAHIMRKLGARNAADLVRTALRMIG